MIDFHTIIMIITVFLLSVVLALLIRERKISSQAQEALGRVSHEKEQSNSHLSDLALRIEALEKSNRFLKEIIASHNEKGPKADELVIKRFSKFLSDTKVDRIMSRKIATIHFDSPFSMVPEIMEKARVRHLPVVDINKRLVGLVTQRLLYKIHSPRRLPDGTWYYDKEMLNNVILKHVMVTDVQTSTRDQSIGSILEKIVQSNLGSIPIIDENQKIIGIVTRKDLLRKAVELYQKGKNLDGNSVNVAEHI